MIRHASAALVLSGVAALAWAGPLVGIMEDDRSETVNWAPGPAKNRVVRPLFEKDGDDWVVSTTHDREIDWVIVLEGKSLGNLRSRPNAVYSGPSAGLHEPLPQPGQRLVHGKPSKGFSGWQDTLFYRPLVLVSGGGFADPDQWKRFRPSVEQVARLRATFRSRYPKVVNCDKDEMPLPPGAWRYRNDQIRVAQGYRSPVAGTLVNMWLDGSRCGMSSGVFDPMTFLVAAGGGLAQLKVPARNDPDESLSLKPVYAADFDGDGKSELLFFAGGYNEDGYVLFYDSLRKHVAVTWGYH